MRHLTITLLFVLFSCALYRAVPDEQAHFDIDSAGYQELAETFYHTNTFVNQRVPERAPVQPVGYPFFMAIVYKTVGVKVWALIFVQVMLLWLSIVLLLHVSSLLFSEAVTRVVAYLAVFNVGFLVYPQFILAETVQLFFIMLFMYLFVSFYQSKYWYYLCSSAAILGLSTIIKPTALCSPILIIPIVVYVLWRSANGVNAVAGAVLFIISFYTPVLLYMLRNYDVYGYFNFAPMMPLNMYQCLLAKVMSRVEGLPVQDIVDTQLRFSATNTFDAAGWDHAKKLFYDYLWQYPTTFVVVWVQNVTKTVFGLFSTQLKVLIEPLVRGGDCSFFLQEGSFLERINAYIVSGSTHWWVCLVSYVEALWSVVRWVLVITGFGFLCAEKKYGLVCIFVLCIMQFSVVTGMDGCCRYRIIFEPILIMICAYALVQWYYLIKRICAK